MDKTLAKHASGPSVENDKAYGELTAYLHPIRSARTFETAIEQIVDLIEKCRLRPGDRLPNLPQLADSMDISRPTTQQALRVLERAGLVRLQRGAAGGVYVTSELVPMELLSSEVEVAQDELVEALAARRIFEGVAAHLAMQRAESDDFHAIERTIQLTEAHQDDWGAALRTDGMYHRAIARAAHDPYLERTITQILQRLMPLREAWGSSERVKIQKADGKRSGYPRPDAPAFLHIHRRQVEIMRARRSRKLDEILHEHFDWLERLLAWAIDRDVEDLFGVPRESLIGKVSLPRVGTK